MLFNRVSRMQALAWYQRYHGMIAELKCQYAFSSAVQVRSPRVYAVSAQPAGVIRQGLAPVIGAEEPVPGSQSMMTPMLGAIDRKSGGARIKRCLGFDRLLVERHMPIRHSEPF